MGSTMSGTHKALGSMPSTVTSRKTGLGGNKEVKEIVLCIY